MKRKLTGMTTILAMTIALSALSVTQADAAIRIRAEVRLPGGVIEVRTPGQPVRVIQRLPDRCDRANRRHADLSRQDRQVARRLARHTGVEGRELMRLKRQGYRWVEIGRWLGVSPRGVLAAHHAHTWAQYQRSVRRLDRERRPAHGHGPDRCQVTWNRRR